MSTTRTPMQHFGTTVRLHGGGGFDVRGCPEPEALAETIVRACNAHDQLVTALQEALSVIDDYIAYEHNGDPWTEDARAMGEMDIDDYSRDGRLEAARAALTAAGAA